MGTVISISNQKGGVGKTTTAVNLAASLAAAGYRILLIDMDPQGNASSGVGIDGRARPLSMYDVLMGRADLADVVCPTEMKHLFLAPSHVDLVGAEVELVTAAAREARLKAALPGVRDAYDYVLLDCPPSLGLVTLNALAAADQVLVPVQCEYYALEGLGQLTRTVDLVRRQINPALEVLGVLLTMADRRNNLSQQVSAEVRRHFGAKVFTAVIPRNVTLAEAPSHGRPILLYNIASLGAQAYLDLAREVVGRTRRPAYQYAAV
jgi:chromosome partitioning protein